jgi:hypothetical protein
MRNIATRTKADGGALSGIVEKFMTGVVSESRTSGARPENVIREKLAHLAELVGGYDFVEVISAYWLGFETDKEELKTNAIRWLRGEFSTRTDARAALGVRTIIDDSSIYDQLKLLARFVRLAGFSGLLICFDELVNLYKLANTQARNANYEQILRILNDVLQNPPEGLGFLLGGTPEFLLDTRRGLYSYPALQSRLAENTFAKEGLVDLTSPVIRLGSLSGEEFLVLLGRLRHVYASGKPEHYLVNDDALVAFMHHCHQRLGDAYFRTPRTTITAFINLLAILEQNPSTKWTDLLGGMTLEKDQPPALVEPVADASEQGDELTSFKL